MQVKGFRVPIKIYEVPWKEDEPSTSTGETTQMFSAEDNTGYFRARSRHEINRWCAGKEGCHRKHFIQSHRGESRCVIGHGVRDDELALMDEATAGIDDIGDVAFALVLVGLDDRFAGAGELRRIIAVEQKRADAVFAHGTHAVADDQLGRASRSRMGEPQLPSCTNSHGNAGLNTTWVVVQKWTWSENMM